MNKTDPKNRYHATWRKKIQEALEGDEKETWDGVVAYTPQDLDLDREFDDGFGIPEGTPFRLWTKNRVYFPVCYDGSETIESVPRNPSKEECTYFGGW